MQNQQPDSLVAASSDYIQKLTWVAIYQNGEVIIQREENGMKSSEVLDHSKIYIFHLVTDDDRPIFTLRLRPGQKFFYRARTAMRAGIGVLDRIHILGWRKEDEKAICFVSETDMHIEVGDFIYKNDPYRRLRPWIYEVNWRELDETPIAEIVDEIEDTEPVSL